MSLNFSSVIMVLAVLAGSIPAQADIYSYKDENGVVTYTNVKPNSARYKVHVAYKDQPKHTATVYYYPDGNNPVALPPRLKAIVNQAANEYSVDKSLVKAVIHAESAFNSRAVSPKGASGLMQLMPDTAERYGVNDIFDPEQNVVGGVRYLRDLLDTFGNDKRLALAAYNAGENSVLRYGGVPPYPETVHYVDRVLKLQTAYTGSF